MTILFILFGVSSRRLATKLSVESTARENEYWADVLFLPRLLLSCAVITADLFPEITQGEQTLRGIGLQTNTH